MRSGASSKDPYGTSRFDYRSIEDETKGSWSRAAEYFRLEAESAIARHDFQEAVDLARRGLKSIENLPEAPERARLELALLGVLADPLVAISGIDSAEFRDLYNRAMVLARYLGDPTHITLRIH